MMAQSLAPFDAAEMFTARGWVVFPCDHPDAGLQCTGSARACRDGRCKAATDVRQRGKHPRVPRWGEITEPVDEAQRIAWWGRGALAANVAIACGPSGLLIIDEDEPGAFARWCASIGVELPATFRVLTGRGVHYYFTLPVDPQTGERLRIGNSPGALAGWHIDVRGGASGSAEAGGYVITAGSRHANGLDYRLPDLEAQAIPAPGWLIEALTSPGPSTPTEGLAGADGDPGGSTRLRASDGARWDDATRYGTREDLFAQFERHCDEVSHTGGEFRFELFRAARDGWRLVHLGLLAEDEMQRALEACVWRVWEAEPNDDDMKIYWEEALPAARRSPWELTGTELRARASATVPPDRAFLRSSEAAALAADHAVDHPDAPGVTSEDDSSTRTTDGNRPVDRDHAPSPDDEARRYARKLATKIEDERLRREARAALDAEAAEADELPCFTPKQRRDRPRPEYLVPKMIYRNGLTVLFGPTGAGKSTFALDVALCLASGQQWRGTRLTNAIGERGRVHYVMAEGEDSTNLRFDAWLYHHGYSDDDLEGQFWGFPAVVALTEAGIARYLPHVRRDEPDLIILDTKNLMFAGRESAGEDLGEMLRAIRALQAAAQGCAVILIDHPGLNDPTRVRGGNAEEAGADIVVRMADEDGLRVAEVTKDRAAQLGQRWQFRLHQIPEVERGPYIDAPVVCIPVDEHDPISSTPDWWLLELSEDHTKAITNALNDKGQPAEGKKAAQDIVRLMRKVRSEQGLTEPEIFQMIKEKPVIKPRRGPKPLPHSRSSVGAGRTLLERIGAIESTGQGRGVRYGLTPSWRS